MIKRRKIAVARHLPSSAKNPVWNFSIAVLLLWALTASFLAATPAAPLCRWLGGRVQRVDIPSAALGATLQARIYVPPCYEEESARRYPLLTLLHGQNFSDDQWDALGVDEIADRLIPSGLLPPFVVFMPRETRWELPPQSAFGRALMEDALPWLEAHYRLLPERRYRAVGGISRGGAWAWRLGLTHWDVWGAVGGHSAPLFAGDGLRVYGWLAAIPPGRWPRLYLDVGDADREEILQSVREFETALTRQGVPHVWRFNVGRHDPIYWQRHTREYLRWYTCPWLPGNPTCPPEP